jgi:thioredoxin reductase
MKNIWDVIIIGAGPSGMSAALILGRCLRKVVICDAGPPRNAASFSLHGYLTRDGIDPDRFREIGRAELRQYPNVSILDGRVCTARRFGAGFEVELAEGLILRSRKLLLATGIVDKFPDINGAQECWGISVHQCPYCDGWESQNRQIAVYGKGARGYTLARTMTAWSRNIYLCTDGSTDLSKEKLDELRQNGVQIIFDPIDYLEHDKGKLKAIVFQNKDRLECEKLFFNLPTLQQSKLSSQLGCAMNDDHEVVCRDYESTNIPGVYVAGNAIKDIYLAIVAAGEGAKAAFSINSALTREDFHQVAARDFQIFDHSPSIQ